MFFKREEQKEQKTKSVYAQKSIYGRGISSIDSEISLMYKEAKDFDPLLYIVNDSYFLGLDHITQEPLYLNPKDVVHALITAPTRAGKGIFFGIKAVESLRKRKGLIVFDPKEDEFLPQIIQEELLKQDRPNDFIVWNWPNDFGYNVFEDDTSIEASKKLAIMLNLIEKEDEAGASFYRKSERIALKKLVDIFFESKELLGVEFERDLPSLCRFIGYVVDDLVNSIEYSKEKNKPKPNVDLLLQCAKRYFNPKLFSINISFRERDIPTLESLHFSLSEFENILFSNTYSILDALIKGKCIYIKSDMLDETALKFLKFVIADIVNKARKHKKYTNCLVIADEVSFYPTSILSAALATVAGFGVQFILAYQDDGQLLDENLKAAIKSNCQTKLYYKSSDISTIEYIEKLSGMELVSKATKNGMELTIRQEQETLLNINRQRALPKARVALLIQESLPKPLILDSSPIKVLQTFDWAHINSKKILNHFTKLEKAFSVNEAKKKVNKVNKEVDEINFEDDIEEIEKFEL